MSSWSLRGSPHPAQDGNDGMATLGIQTVLPSIHLLAVNSLPVEWPREAQSSALLSFPSFQMSDLQAMTSPKGI